MDPMHDNANSLNDDEKQRLRAIEAELQREDPELTAAFAKSLRGSSVPFSQRVGGVAGLTVGALAGVSAIAAGIMLSAPAVGIVGFAVVVVALNTLLDVAPIAERARSLFRLHGDSPSDGEQSVDGE